MKKIITIFIAIIMMISLSTINTFAADETFEKGGLTYTIIGDNSVSVTDADLSVSVYNIPDKITYNNVEYTVVSLGNGLFYESGQKAALTSITLPDSLQSIGSAAFKNCTKLTSIVIPNGVKVIEDSTFKTCTRLKSVQLPDQLTAIKGSAFHSCMRLESIDLPDSVKDIANNVFIDCDALVSVVIPKNVEYLGAASFWYCDQLKEITMPNRIQTVEGNAFQYSPLISKVMVVTDSEDEPINSQILTAMGNADNSPQLYRAVTNMKVKQEKITSSPNNTINLDSYFSTSFGIYDENGHPSSAMTIPQNYQRTEYQLIGDHSDYTYIVGNQLTISDEETKQLQIEGNLNGYTDLFTIDITILDMTSIEIVKMPDKTIYTEGELFDPLGLKIKINYSDGSHKLFTYNEESKDNFHFSIQRPLQITDQKVLMHFGNQSIELNITVQSKPIINDNQNNESQKDQTQNQNKTPITGDYTATVGLSVLILLSGTIILMSSKRRKDKC